jgi:alpha-D-ribose 1-methylphosphonate 5-triphosphate diphosphatase
MKGLRFVNARIVTREQIVATDLLIEDGFVRGLGQETAGPVQEINCQGDLLLPGLIELHTDNLEKHVQPRPGVRWPSILAAALAHDIQIAGAGITTVYDALALGGLRSGGLDPGILEDSYQAIKQAQQQGLFRADHALHLRCEVADSQVPELLTKYGEDPLVRLLSVMDHTPGQRQWTDIDKWRLYHRDKNWTEAQVETVRRESLELQQRYAEDHRRLTIAFARERNIPLASHDDTTPADAEQAVQAGIGIAEFPTTLAAARSAADLGMAVILGAPNVVRGESHSGNVAARDLARLELLDGLSSDYVPASLLHAVFLLSEEFSIPLPKTVMLASVRIAEMLNLSDRGEIAPEKRADLVRVVQLEGVPVVKNVWCAGRQVM